MQLKVIEMIAAAQEGDVCVLHFSGHGTQIPSPDGEEKGEFISGHSVLLWDVPDYVGPWFAPWLVQLPNLSLAFESFADGKDEAICPTGTIRHCPRGSGWGHALILQFVFQPGCSNTSFRVLHTASPVVSSGALSKNSRDHFFRRYECNLR